MYVLISVLVVIVCVLLVLIVLVQNSKGGGLASNFQSAQFMGVRRTTDFLEKATWTLAVALMLFSILGSLTIPRGETEQKSVIEDQIDNVVDPNAIPTFPTTTPDREGESPTGQ